MDKFLEDDWASEHISSCAPRDTQIMLMICSRTDVSFGSACNNMLTLAGMKGLQRLLAQKSLLANFRFYSSVIPSSYILVFEIMHCHILLN
jgi:hypothetical protein